MASDWDAIENEYKKDFKDYAPEGEFETKVKAVEQIESSQKKTPGLTFTFEDNDQYAFPKFGTTHWISFNNEKWRKHHFKELMCVLGVTEDAARKAVDTCENKGSQDAIVKAYTDAFNRLVSKHPSVMVAVYKRTPDSKYTSCDFADFNVRMNRPEVEAVSEEPLAGAQDASDEINLDELPF